MLHKPATPAGKDPAGPYKMRLGIWMFISYSIFYASFVAINLLNPLAMASIVLAGLNLATVYGFALIIVALIEALVYDWLCRRKEAFFETAEKLKHNHKKANADGKGKA
jgi:antibiotic biosynthesis monooxygenase (ABM) superfamily enzyme